MVIDSSAVVAIQLNEPDAAFFVDQLDRDPRPMISAVTLLEINMALSGKALGPTKETVAQLLQRLGVIIVPFDAQLAEVAFRAFQLFGKRRHKAELNFGDCMAYATAKAFDLRLLCKDNDFAQTDLPIVSPSA